MKKFFEKVKTSRHPEFISGSHESEIPKQVRNDVSKVRRAFTLAEVLITLLIIGVVAAITIPTLMNNINDSILKKQRKTTAAKVAEGFRNMMAHGALAEKYENTQKFADAMKKYFNISQVCDISNWSNCISDFDITDMGISMGEIMPLITDPNAMISIKLADGTGMLIKYNKNMAGLSEGDTDKVWYEKDPKTGDMMYASFGLSFSYMLDVNGDKGPNTIGKDIIDVTNELCINSDSECEESGPYFICNSYGGTGAKSASICNDAHGSNCFAKIKFINSFDSFYYCSYCNNMGMLLDSSCGTCEEL